mmetsp:Transcript_23010/g.31524  ORF Transcript_23010/g.31524 Transcript_23010/m.31524 type:complete len:318 (-) Transcript_23010:100-1053(-)
MIEVLIFIAVGYYFYHRQNNNAAPAGRAATGRAAPAATDRTAVVVNNATVSAEPNYVSINVDNANNPTAILAPEEDNGQRVLAAIMVSHTADADNRLREQPQQRDIRLEIQHFKEENIRLVKELPESVYGFFFFGIFVLDRFRQERDFWNDVFFYTLLFIPTFMAFLIQGSLLGFLWYSLVPVDDDNSGFCNTSPTFHVVLITTFLLYIHKHVYDLIVELWIYIIRFIVFVVWIFEFLVTLELVVVGVKYVLVQEGASNLIQAVLSLVFVAEIDNVGYLWLVCHESRLQMKATFFIVFGYDIDGADQLQLRIFTYYC